MNPDTPSLATSLAPYAAYELPECRQTILTQDSACFVSRGLAILWRERLTGDLAACQQKACELLAMGDEQALRKLLREQPELIEYRGEDEAGMQLLHRAAIEAEPAMLDLLLAEGALLDSPSGHLQGPGDGGFVPGATPLLLACEAGRELVAQRLLEAGADPCARWPSSGETALHAAVAREMSGLAEALIRAGADVDAMGEAGEAPLHRAARMDLPLMVSCLLKAGASAALCRADGLPALHCAAATGALGALEVCLAAGIDPDQVSSAGTALQLAARQGNDELASLLLGYGANPLLIDADSGLSALDMAEQAGHAALCARLMEVAKGEAASTTFFSRLDDVPVANAAEAYTEMHAFLSGLLAEFPLASRSLLVLSDWLADMLGPANRPLLARAYREARQMRAA